MAAPKQGKRERLARSQEIFERYETEETLEVIVLKRGKRRGILTIKSTTMEWNVYADPAMSQHVDWNDPDCYPEYASNRKQFPSPMHFVSLLVEKGWMPCDDD